MTELDIVGDLPDVPGWTHRRQIRSGSSSRLYIIAQRVKAGVPVPDDFGCSCPGWKRNRRCKHLTTLNLKTAPRTAIGPASRTRRDSSASFADSAYEHYDTSGGFGSPDEWLRAIEGMAAGRGRYVPPAGGQARIITPDMRALGLTAMPSDAAGLLSAMRAQSRRLHPDIVHPTDSAHRTRFPQCPECDAAVTAFTAIQLAYGRLLRRYPKK